MEVNINDALNTLPFSVWDEIASNLETQSGMATVDLPLLIQELHARSFSVARHALDAVKKTTTTTTTTFLGGNDDNSSDKEPVTTTLPTDHDETAISTSASSVVKVIAPGEASAHVTGFHWAGGSNSMSRYNTHREGFVFSDGQRLPVSTVPEFECSMEHLFESLHGIANHVLMALERKWDLPPNYFQQSMGPTRNSSQWHVKRYVQENENGKEKEEVKGLVDETSSKKDEGEAKILLPSHTDPSLVSVVIHDQVGRLPGAMGLQYYRTASSSVAEELTIGSSAPTKDDEMDKDDKNKQPQQNHHHPQRVWTEVPFHGHAVATIFVGSVLSYITGGRLSSVKHRVVQSTSASGAVQDSGGRMAATFFVRPQGTALLQVPPSPRLKGVFLKTNMTFDVWNARVSKNYMKKSNPQKEQANGATNVTSNSNSKSQKSNISTSPKAENKDNNDDDDDDHDGYYCDDITEMSLISGTPPLKGRDKYLGGEVGSNGKIYTIPGHATRVLVMDPFVDPITVIPIGPELCGEYKWLRGVLAPDTGIIYGIPCHADAILRIDTSTNHVSTITWNVNDLKAPPVGLPWKWHGGNISKYDGCLYCVPQFAEYVMKINTITEEVSFMGDRFPGTNKWYGGLVGKADGAIYGICQNATGVLRIDPERQTTAIHGAFPWGG
jgi:isopenicillin N synthase-like dioxygenase